MTRDAGQQLHLVSCRIGDEEYCLDTGSITGICRAEMLSRKSPAPGTIGSVLWNKARVPVFDLAVRLSRTFKQREEPELVLVLKPPAAVEGIGSRLWGLAIDG